jgi:hypothetical protein
LPEIKCLLKTIDLYGGNEDYNVVNRLLLMIAVGTARKKITDWGIVFITQGKAAKGHSIPSMTLHFRSSIYRR